MKAKAILLSLYVLFSAGAQALDKAVPVPADDAKAISSIDPKDSPAAHDRYSIRGVTPLMQAANSGDAAKARALIAKGANVNARDGKGDTALIFAAINGQEDAILALLEAGADPFIKGSDGMTALSAAEAYYQPKVIPILEKATASKNAR